MDSSYGRRRSTLNPCSPKKNPLSLVSTIAVVSKRPDCSSSAKIEPRPSSTEESSLLCLECFARPYRDLKCLRIPEPLTPRFFFQGIAEPSHCQVHPVRQFWRFGSGEISPCYSGPCVVRRLCNACRTRRRKIRRCAEWHPGEPPYGQGREKYGRCEFRWRRINPRARSVSRSVT